MTIDAIRDAVKKVPFQPFDIHVRSGRHFHIAEPEWVYFPPRSRSLVVFNSEGSATVIDPAYLVEIKPAIVV